jgi:hypothetical protein
MRALREASSLTFISMQSGNARRTIPGALFAAVSIYTGCKNENEQHKEEPEQIHENAYSAMGSAPA